jgi:peptidoglycan/xylan/chitin deacetylase (PgdA/CDA1 family)
LVKELILGMHYEIADNNNHMSITSLIITSLVGLYLFILLSPIQEIFASTAEEKPCNCVVFRMDDLQDYWLNKAQVSVMDLFLSKNQSLSLGLIVNGIGNDSLVINKIDEGLRKGLFELGIHGWNHTDYTQLTGKEQKESLNKANEKINSLFDIKSDIFIAPEGAFNNETLKAMKELDIKVISNAIWAENEFDAGKSIFNETSNITTNQHNETTNQSQAYHIPGTISFTDYKNGSWTLNSIKNIINNATTNIDTYGYAVVVLHPQDFVKMENGEFVDELDENKTKILSKLINTLRSNEINLSTFSNIADIPVKVLKIPTSVSCPAFYETIGNKDLDYLRPSDPIRVEGLYGEKCVLTQIYNTYGKYLYEKAGELGISPSTAAAVVFVETRGSGFGPDGKMVIRFEACDFYDAWGKDHSKEFSDSFYCDTSAMGYNDKFRNSSSEQFMEYHGDHYKEWKVFEFARKLDEKAALNSISMGLGQIMGFNHDKIGYETVEQMFTNMSSSLGAQLDGFFMALEHNKDASGGVLSALGFNNNVSCLDSLKTSDFVGFASCYNASGQDQIYGDKIKKSVPLYSEITSGKKYGNK